ncbi:hypothetical protein ABZ858_06565 [Streptomyces sp. NPDC047017]|uniref:hypothetical protein n=1 Tax=Streptomyces sp. NPDC047017 TaxID=3155024 RepID=UPI0033FB9E49
MHRIGVYTTLSFAAAVALTGAVAGQASADSGNDPEYRIGSTIIFNNGDGNTTNTQIGNAQGVTQGGGIGNTQGGTQSGTGNVQGGTQGGAGNTQGGTQGGTKNTQGGTQSGTDNTQGGTQSGTGNTQGGTQGSQLAAAAPANAARFFSPSTMTLAAVDAAMASASQWQQWVRAYYLPAGRAVSVSGM